MGGEHQGLILITLERFYEVHRLRVGGIFPLVHAYYPQKQIDLESDLVVCSCSRWSDLRRCSLS